MLKKIKLGVKKNLEIFALFLLIVITITFTSYYNHNKKKVFINYSNLLDNIYFKKSFNQILNSLEPRFKKIEHEMILKKQRIEQEKSLEYWKGLDGLEFENRIGELFEDLGHVVEYTSQTGDQGVDLFIDNDMVVQCKAHEAQISPAVIRDMYGTMMHFKKKKAIVISSGGFTKGCYQFAKDKPIELWDLKVLISKCEEKSN